MRPVSNNTPDRRPASAVPTITGLRFMPQDIEASLVNISTKGVLAESSARVPVGTALELIFEGGFTPRSANGRVARCEVAVMGTDSLLRYQIAIEFDAPIALGDDVIPGPALPPQQPRNRW